MSLQLGDAIIKVQPRMLVLIGTALQWLQNRFAEAFLLYDKRARAVREEQLAMEDAEARKVAEQLVAQEVQCPAQHTPDGWCTERRAAEN